MKAKEHGSIPLLKPEAPLLVKIAVFLFALVWLRQMLYLVPILFDNCRQDHYQPEIQQQAIATLAFWLALNAALMLALAYQKNWARITQTLSTVIGLLVLLWDVTRGDFKPGIVYFSDVTATILLFLPPSDAWFKKHPSRSS